jgi:two-component system sensor histidine kinase ChiS
MRKHLEIMLGIIVLFFVVLFFFLFDWLHPHTVFPEAREGVLDARGWNFTEQGIIPLKGEWEFYEGKLLSPADFGNSDQPQVGRRIVKVPANWKGIMASDGQDGYGAGTYRLVIQVDQPDIYSLRAKKIRMASHIYMNGTDLGGNGRTALQESGFIASNLPFFGSEKVQGSTMEIIVQAASFKIIEGGLVQTPEFGPTRLLMDRRDNSRLADMVQMATMLLFTLYYAGMFRQWRKERHLMYFSLFCLATGLFFSVDNEILLSLLLPDLPFVWLQKALFVWVFLSFMWFALYIYTYLGLGDDAIFRWLRRVNYMYIVLIILLPNEYLSSAFWLNIGLQTATFMTIFVALFRSWRKGTPDVVYLLMGVFFLVISWIFAQLRYGLALDNPYYMIVTPLLLVFSQAFLMSNRIQQAFQKNERLSKQLREYDRQKDEFLAQTSHELRTPLHGIINLSQSLLDDSADSLNTRQRENIRLVNLVGRRLAGLVHDILDMSQIQQGQLYIRATPVDIRMATRFVFEILSITPANSQTFLVDDLPEDLPLVLADENRLKQILYNLLENGLKYTEKGTVRIFAERRGEMVAISVSDTGSGIPESARKTIFLPFQQYREVGESSAGGIGLGLSITKQLVELQGGTLEMETEVGKGSCFTFTLPITHMEAKQQQTYLPEMIESIPLSSPVQSDPASFTVLIIDDEPSNVKILIDAVSSLKYAYTAVQSGKEALEMLRRSFKPDLVLLDLMMPGVSGLDVCKEIRSLHSLVELPVLMLTASGQRRDMMASFSVGANDILHKPFELAELKARVQSLLFMKRASEQAVRKEIDFLQAQITPHFLYNSMNALIGLSYKDMDKLRETIHHLTTYLRAKFTFSFQGQLVSFEQELELVKAYLAIEQLRFGSRLNISYRIQHGLHCMLPPLTLQPLVENAVRHGIGSKPTGGTVEISASIIEGDVHIAVKDDGVGMAQEVLSQLNQGHGEGIGIGNVNRRLQMIYSQKLEIASEPELGTQVKFYIPEEFHAQSRLDR